MLSLTGFPTLFKKEVLRFWKVGFQTIFAPVMSALLYQLIFGHVMKNQPDILPGVGYAAFLIPGLAMMSMTQNAFANASSSLVQSRISGNLVFILLPPISTWAFFWAYVGAAIVRGLFVGAGVLLVCAFFGLTWPVSPVWALIFAIMGCAIMGTLGLLAGIVAEKFDQMALFQNFIIMPLTFLSGVFYSINNLPTFWRTISHFNPVFYMIDGFRYGFFGHSDVSPWLSFSVVTICWLGSAIGILMLLKSGYKLRH